MFWLKKLKKKLAGFVNLDFNDSETATIGLIAVDSDMRGKGVGRRLMAQAESAALKAGKKANQGCYTTEKNVLATNFYEKNRATPWLIK